MAAVTTIGSNTSTTNDTALAITLSASATSGHRVVLAYGGPATISSITDTHSNTWVKDVARNQANSPREDVEIWSTGQGAGQLVSGNTVTITLSTHNTIKGAIVYDVAAGAVDQTSSNTGSGTAMDSNSTLQQSGSNDVAIGAFVNGVTDATWTSGAGWSVPSTNLISFSSRTLMVNYKQLDTNATTHSTGTSDSASNWAAAVATYNALGGGTKIIVPDLASGAGTDSGSVVKAGSSTTKHLTPAQGNGAGSIIATPAAQGAGSGSVIFSKIIGTLGSSGSGSAAGVVNVITTPTGGGTKLINPFSPFGVATVSGTVHTGVTLLIDLDKEHVENVYPVSTDASSGRVRRITRQMYPDRYAPFADPPVSSGSKTRWVVWDSSKNQIVSVHATQADAQTALVRRRKKIDYTQGLNLSVQSVDG